MPRYSSSSTASSHRILVCACSGSGLTPQEKVETLLKGFTPENAEIVPVADLCRIAAKDRETLAQYADTEKLTVVACFPRTIRALLDMADVDVPEDRLTVHNLRTDDPEKIRAILEADCGCRTASADDAVTPEIPADPDAWTPWFPAIDRERCTNCQQCLSFCLFGVYELVNGQVEVTHPDACKTGCPACARICPEVAVIFPKYENSPVNGDEITDLDEQKEQIRVDMQKMLGDNVYAALAERKRRRNQKILLRKQQPQTNSQSQPASPRAQHGNPAK